MGKTFEERYEERRIQEMVDQFGPVFREHGHGFPPPPPPINQAQRVDALIASDREYRVAEHMREMATLEVREGVFVNLADTVIPPTAEWLAKNDTMTFVPKQPDGTVRTIKTVRRVLTPIVVRMTNAGKLREEHLFSCLWYRDQYELGALDGRVKTSSFSDAPGGGGDGTGQHPMARNDTEAEARLMLRKALAFMEREHCHIRLFHQVVAKDDAVRRAAKIVRVDNSRALRLFRVACDSLTRFCHGMKIDTAAKAKQHGY